MQHSHRRGTGSAGNLGPYTPAAPSPPTSHIPCTAPARSSTGSQMVCEPGPDKSDQPGASHDRTPCSGPSVVPISDRLPQSVAFCHASRPRSVIISRCRSRCANGPCSPLSTAVERGGITTSISSPCAAIVLVGGSAAICAVSRYPADQGVNLIQQGAT